MIKKILMAVFFVIALAQLAIANDKATAAYTFPTAELKTPAGLWQTIDDKTNKPRSIVKIFKYQNKYYGRIIAAYYLPGEGPNDVCDQCSANKKNEKILGMIFITNMRQNPDNDHQWIDGLILDPKNGKIYKSKITLSDDGMNLDVRGYIGISLIGRSQTWKRVPDSILKNLPASSVVAENIKSNMVRTQDLFDN